MSSRDDIASLYTGSFYVGPSAIIGLTQITGQNMAIIKCVAAGTSGVYIGGASLGGGIAAGPGATFGVGGYLMATSEILSLNLTHRVNFTSVGTTALISFLIGRFTSVGASLA